MKNGWFWVITIIAFFLLVVIMRLVPPVESGPVWLLVVFFLFYLLFYGLAVFGCKLFFLLRSKLNPAKRGDIDKDAARYGAIVALMPVFLIVLSTNGVLTIVPVIGAFLFVALLCFLTSCSR